MTNNRGYTLIELLVVVSVATILTAALAFSFQGWMGSYQVESQTKTLYTDLINARARAMQINRSHFVDVKANNYRIFEDTIENETLDAGDAPIPGFTNPKRLEYASNWTGTITMDTRGTIDTAAEIFFDKRSNTPDYDCVVLSPVQIKMGQVKGGVCEER